MKMVFAKVYIKNLITISVFFSSVVILGCEQKLNADEVFLEVDSHIQQGEYKTAVIKLKNLLKQNPNNYRARISLGNLYLKIGIYKQAEIEFRKALKKVNDLDLRLSLVKAIVFQENYEQAIQYVIDDFKNMKLPSNLQDEVDLYFAISKAGVGELAYAEKILLQIIEMKKNDQAKIELAKIYFIQQQYSLSEYHIDDVLNKNDESKEAWLIKGDLLAASGSFSRSIDVYSKAITQTENNFVDKVSLNAYLGKVRSYLATGEINKADANVNVLMNTNAKLHPSVQFYRAIVKLEESEFKEADHILTKLLSDYPNNLDSLFLMSVVKFSLKNYAQSEFYIKKILQKDNDNLVARKLLARLKIIKNKPVEAEELLSSYLSDNNDDEIVLLMARIAAQQNYSQLSEKYLSKVNNITQKYNVNLESSYISMISGEFEKAITNLNKLPLSTSKPFIRESLLASAYMQVGKVERIHSLMDEIRNVGKSNVEIKEFIAETYLSLGFLNRAKEHYRKLVKEYDTNEDYMFGYAECLSRLGEYENSNHQLKKLIKLKRNNIKAILMLSDNYMYMNNNKKSNSELIKLLDINIDISEANSLLSVVYFQRNQLDLAQKYAEEVLRVNPSNHQITSLLAKIKTAEGNYAEAIELISGLIRDDGSESEYYIDLANNYLLAEKISDAKYALNNAILLGDNYYPAASMLVNIEMQQGNKDAAFRIINDNKKTAQNSIYLVLDESNYYAQSSEMDMAEKVLVEKYEIQKNKILAIKIFELRLFAGKNKPESILMKWLEDDPYNYEINSVLTNYYMSRNLFDSALEILKNMIHSPTIELLSKNERATIHNNLAWVYFQLEDQESVNQARIAYQLSPNDGAVLDTLGWILLNHGKVIEGYQYLQEAYELLPENNEVKEHYMRAKKLYEKRMKSSRRAQQIHTEIISMNKLRYNFFGLVSLEFQN